MKRTTPLKPSQKPMRRTPFVRTLLKPSARGARQIRHWKTARTPKGERSIFRSEDYLAAVRTLSCVCCGRDGCTEAAHSNQLRFGKGGRIKASDATAMALCRATFSNPGCHATHDQGGTRTKAESWAFEYRHICLTVLALIGSEQLVGDADLIFSIPFVITDWESTAIYFVSLIESGQLEVVEC